MPNEPLPATDASGATDPLGFAQMLLSLIDEGRKTTTYKLAVLMALIDACAAGTDADGNAARRICTRDLARRVMALYWPQVRSNPLAPAGGVLRQGTSSATILERVRELRQAAAQAASPRSTRRSGLSRWTTCTRCSTWN